MVEAHDEEGLVEAVRSADEQGTPVLVVGGGSNLVVADEGFRGRVVVVRNTGLRGRGRHLRGRPRRGRPPGENWDDVVAIGRRRGWVGVEALSGIPGTAGATPIQNVGAYGQEVAQTLARVRTWDRLRRRGSAPSLRADCGFGYRTSRFKQDPGRHLVLSVTFQFRSGTSAPPCSTASSPTPSGSPIGERAPRARPSATPCSSCAAQGHGARP